jgi:hypothetical protein
MTRISAGEYIWIDCCDWDWIVVIIGHVQSYRERVVEVQVFYAAEEFLNCHEMGHDGKLQFPWD